MLTDTGKDVMRDLLSGGSTAYIHWIAVGVGSAALSGNQTVLGSEVYRDAVTVDNATSGQTTMSIYMTSMTGSGYTLNEVGTYVVASGGSCCTRNNISGLVKDINTEAYIDKRFIFTEG